jgi:aspartyl-tRNA(Asn)/glutamyl-tRNA(Gln) amidotransferase subunit C
MAKLSRDDVLHLARLSRLHLSNDEIVQFQKEISDILEYVEQLQGVDLTGIEPTYQVSGLKNVMRKDTPDPENPYAKKVYSANQKELLKNVPAKEDDGHIKVKRVLK